MGMFDYIKCDYPLPGPKPKYIKTFENFQTKDFECRMHSYLIGKRGQLYRVVDGVNHKITWVNDDVCFYDFYFNRDGDRQTSEWIEYVVKFANGKVKAIHVAKHELKETP